MSHTVTSTGSALNCSGFHNGFILLVSCWKASDSTLMAVWVHVIVVSILKRFKRFQNYKTAVPGEQCVFLQDILMTHSGRTNKQAHRQTCNVIHYHRYANHARIFARTRGKYADRCSLYEHESAKNRKRHEILCIKNPDPTQKLRLVTSDKLYSSVAPHTFPESGRRSKEPP